MATEDLYKGVNYNDGEDILYGDLNDGQRFLGARVFDQLIGKLIGQVTGADPESVAAQGADPSTAWAYAIHISGGMLRQGSTNAKIKIGAGTLLQKIANSDGNEAQLLAYTFDGTTEVTISNGHATLNRVDMIQMALSYVTDDSQSRDFQDAVTGANSSQPLNKKRRVQCTVSVKSGTAAANPTYPTPDAGYVPIGCVIVPATLVATAQAFEYLDRALHGAAAAVIHDLRMPIVCKPNFIPAMNGLGKSANWTPSADPSNPNIINAATTGTSPTNALYYYCTARKGRLLGVSMASINGTHSANKARLALVDTSATANNLSYIVDISTTAAGGIEGTGGLNVDTYNTAVLADIEKLAITGGLYQADFTVTGNGTHAPPTWTNGLRAWVDDGNKYGGGVNANAMTSLALALEVFATLQVFGVVFHVAEGL